jgi:type II secretory pathway pseudopilin PulG
MIANCMTRMRPVIAARRRVGARPAMTLIEVSIVVCLLGLTLFLINGWMSNLRDDARRDLAMRQLAELDQALAWYFRAEGQYPHAPGPNFARWATTALLDHHKSRPILEGLPGNLWVRPGRRELTDPWGTPLRYHADPVKSDLVRANSGRPLFVSAGPDGDFGDSLPAGRGDNLRSDDPGPEGFRLHDVMRESLAEESQAGGKEND